METVDKDFKVKHGLQVAGNAIVAGTMAIADPTHDTHAVTKSHLDTALSNISTTAIDTSAPSSPSNGDFWFDTSLERLKVYYGSAWVTLATTQEALSLVDHIHDMTIDGDGRIDTVFYDSSQYDDPQILTIEGGTPFSESWDTILDGGSA
jgi:hypothetical protein